MPAMHAVERADGQDGRAGEGGLSEVVDEVHI
jgi:hypothetical protein